MPIRLGGIKHSFIVHTIANFYGMILPNCKSKRMLKKKMQRHFKNDTKPSFIIGVSV